MSRKPPNEPRDKERIAKVMARAGLCSRRDAETWIVAGRVAVNGERLVSPAFTVSNSDRIEVDGKPLPGRERTRLFLYHKPKGLVTTNRDERGRPTIFGALPKHLPRLMTIGRLDINSEGLLLLTNDGGLARALELPDTGWLRRYRVRAQGRVTQAALDRLSRGITVEGIKYGPIQATLDREQASNVWLTLGLREGKNREVRNVLRELGLSVNRLIRVSYGPFQLGELAPASVEEVKMRVLREQLGGKVERLAGADFSAPLREPDDEAPQKPPRSASVPSPSKANAGKPEFGKASRASPSSPPARGRWKSKRNVARGRGPQR
jgi:23S rRNA pseudouridine2605 synthase